MKTKLGLLEKLGAIAFVLLASSVVSPGQNFYFNADAGPAFADNVDLRQFVVRTPNTEIELDPGVRFSAAGGYHFNEFIGVQLETGFIYNEIDGIDGAGSIDASLAHVPLLAEFVLRYDKPDCRFVPFAGVGFGGDVSVLDLDHVRGPRGVGVDGTGSDLVFAWQVFAGARYRLNESMSIGGGYKFYSADGAAWDVEDVRGDIKSDTAQVHSFGVDFNWKF